jgi:hypothetical protein
MTKQQIYSFLCKHSRELFNRKGGILNIKKHAIFNEINYDFKNSQDLYDYLNNITKKDKKCKLETCKNDKKFITFEAGYRQYCSIKCANKWLSISRTGEGNPIHRISDENRIKWKNTLSKQVKERIKLGKWTPECTNSWCYSRYSIQFYRNGNIVNQKVRSSWEAFFQLLNPNLLYEKLRLPYTYKGEWHTYLIDFIDIENKIVYELKPSSEIKKNRNILKENVLIKWCIENNYTYKKIDEHYFKKINFDKSILNDQPDKDKLIKFLGYFNNEN